MYLAYIVVCWQQYQRKASFCPFIQGKGEGENFTFPPAENEVLLFKISRSIQSLESDFVSLSPSPPAKAVCCQWSELELQFSFEFSDAFLMQLFRFEKCQTSHCWIISSNWNKILNLETWLRHVTMNYPEQAIPPRSYFVGRHEKISTPNNRSMHFYLYPYYFQMKTSEKLLGICYAKNTRKESVSPWY